MKVLIVGQGGREHALVKAFSLSPTISEVHVAPGNPGMTEATIHSINPSQQSEIIELCQNKKIDFVFIGPEVPLAEGLSDSLRAAHIPVVGPERKAAQLESSKIFAKEFMTSAQIPTARSFVVSTVSDCLQKATAFKPPYVLKADGLAAGKGVYICETVTELEQAAQDLFEKKVLGSAGTQALLEEFKPGWELSYLVVTNGIQFQTLPLAQDHKRLQDNNKGPNTGGMGTVAPLRIDETLDAKIIEKVIRPTLAELQRQNLLYRGILFLGIMINENEPSVLEYNVRFGDPETQVILPLIKSDLGKFFYQVAQGEVPQLEFHPNLFATCVVLAAENYPYQSVLNAPISGLLKSSSQEQYFIHSGTTLEGDQWLTAGGRVLGAVGIGPSAAASKTIAYSLAEKVSWKGLQYRKDIGDYLPVPTDTNRA